MVKKHSPRRGSMAFRPRGRTKKVIPRIRNWELIDSEKPGILGSAGIKVGSIHIITIDDRKRNPNTGKPLFNAATIIATPTISVLGFRSYINTDKKLEVKNEIYVSKIPKEIEKKVSFKTKEYQKKIDEIKKTVDSVELFRIIACLVPKRSGLAQKKPFIFELEIGGGEKKNQLEYILEILGKEIRTGDILESTSEIDVISTTKGKGFQGVVSRMGVKRKSHKSRKTVREVASIGPWKPANVMYTVPRAGQKGVHQRTEYNKRILMISDINESESPINRDIPHYGKLEGEYIILKGSIAGPPKTFVRMRFPARSKIKKVELPKVIEISNNNG